MLTALPHEFLSKVAAADLESDLPPPGHYGVGIAFLPTDPEERRICKETVNEIIREQGQILIGWRPLPTRADEADIGPSARVGEPAMEQLFIAAADGLEQEALERQLFIIRKMASHRLRGSDLKQALLFYLCSLSTKVLVYKGMLTTPPATPLFS